IGAYVQKVKNEFARRAANLGRCGTGRLGDHSDRGARNHSSSRIRDSTINGGSCNLCPRHCGKQQNSEAGAEKVHAARKRVILNIVHNFTPLATTARRRFLRQHAGLSVKYIPARSAVQTPTTRLTVPSQLPDGRPRFLASYSEHHSEAELDCPRCIAL